MSGQGWFRPSPFSAAVVAGAKISRAGLHGDGARFYWVESRPAEGGRQVVVVDSGGTGAPGVGAEGAARGGRGAIEVSPPGRSIRSRVHEYGGGAATVSGGVLYFVDQHDQRLYRLALDAPGGAPVALTPCEERVAHRYADGWVTASGAWFVCVEEAHPAGGGPRDTTHRVVAVATDGSQRVVPLVGPDGLVASPRPSPDGYQLAWVGWHHPHLPWDESEVWVADLVDEPHRIALGARRRVAGGAGVSVGQPRWCRDGALVFVDDRTGWWMPYRWPGSGDGQQVGGGPVALVELEAELHAPDWALGQSTWAELPDGSIAARLHRDGRDHLVRLRPPAGPTPAQRGEGRATGPGGPWSVEVIAQPCVTIAGVAVAADGSRIAVLGSTPAVASAVVELDLDRHGWWQLLSDPPTSPVPDGEVAKAQPFVAPTAAGPVPGLLYVPPAGAGTGTGGPPPLVVFCHGGPTGAAEPGFDPVVQFFASRGIAVAAVDYRGSSGYGRRYRQSLQGLWGEADVDDCIAYARALARAGLVDGRRMAIRGSSAGGLTALGALVRSDRFAGAASWYGVTDLEALAADTHDFESCYLDGLVGPLPEARERYRERSPIHHAAQLSGTVLLLQGADDPVVPAGQSERFAAELAAHGVPCTLEVFPGESHGFRQASTIEACLTAELELYASLLAPERAR